MALANIAAQRSRISAPNETISLVKTISAGASSILASCWAMAPHAGAAPSTAAVPDRSTAGALGQQNGGAAALRIVQALIHASTGGGQSMPVVMIDRLSHQGGLSGTTTGAQTTNLPTAALTRYTSGVGVMAALEIYTAVGTTATVARMSYTNQAGTAGQTSPDVVFGGSANREGNRFVQLPLQAGDTGVRSVESVTIDATTGTAGNFGVTLYRPLLAFPSDIVDRLQDRDPLLLGLGFPDIVDDACLSFLVRTFGASPGTLLGELRFAED